MSAPDHNSTDLHDAALDSQRPLVSSRAPFAIALQSEGSHTGLLFRGSSGYDYLHLAWHDDLRLQTGVPHGEFIWATPDTEPERVATLVARCRQLYRQFQRHRRLPYGIAAGDSHFDERGVLQLGAGCRGLTCCTFVLAVFQGVGLRLIDLSTWPVRTDDDLLWLDGLASSIAPAHYEQLHLEVVNGCRRVRPPELLASCSARPLPATYAHVESAVSLIHDLLARGATRH